MDPLQEPLAGGGGLQRCAADVDPPPRPWPGLQKLAIVTIAAIVVLGCLQFLPPTHFRNPNDPQRNWIPIDGSRNPTGSLNDVGSVDVFSWISCLDLRTLAALANSTLSSSSQKQIKDKLNVATPEGNFLWSFHTELSPFLITKSQLSKKRYVYIAADSIIKGKVEDLARMDLGSYAFGAVEDCSKRLNDYISMDVLSAIQRAGAAQSWVSKEPYNKDACLLDFDVLLIEPRKLEKNLVASIMWWVNAINLANQRDQIRLAVTLAFNDKYMKLPSNWKRTDGDTDILNFDGPKNVCSEDGRQHEQSGYGATWQQYLNQKFEAILNT